VNTAAKAMGRDARAALAFGVTELGAAGVPSAALSAELLLLHVVRHDRAWLYAHPDYVLSVEEEATYEEFLARRASGVPTQYLTGVQEFWGLEFEVTPSVLIPRPETEHVVEVALARLAETATLRGVAHITIADVGTGSGCIAVALARELPQARLVAADISAEALEVAQRNIDRHGVSDRVRVLQTDLLEGAASQKQKPERESRLFDLIVSNPPYVARDQAGELAVEVREHEPHEALFGGATGAEIYARLIAQAAAALRPGGILILELGYDGAERVRALFLENASDENATSENATDENATASAPAPQVWVDVRVVNDLAGIPRVISAIRAEESAPDTIEAVKRLARVPR
jgi:release factor glutamine methyltransferase